jgi:hypothetical protein
VDPEQPRGRLDAHRLRDRPSPIAALRHELGVAEALHELDPGTRDARNIPPGGGRLGGEPVARQRRDHEMERVARASAVRRGVRERVDDRQLLDHRAKPSVGDDERRRVLVLRADVDEMDVEPVDLDDEVGRALILASHFAPVVVGRPVASEVLHQC